MEKKNALKETLDKLEKGLKNIFEDRNYKEFLKVMSKFHNYSFQNCLLIYMQNPGATLVKGYKGWQNEFNRNVKKGEKGLKIIRPIIILTISDGNPNIKIILTVFSAIAIKSIY